MMFTARLDFGFFFFTLSSPFISPRLYQLHFCLSIKLECCVICSDLQFQAEEHGEEDKTETEEADGQADQPPEHSSLPGWVVELLTACNRTAALHSLQRQQRKKKTVREGSRNSLLCHDCNHLNWKMDDHKFVCKMCSIITDFLSDCISFFLFTAIKA